MQTLRNSLLLVFILLPLSVSAKEINFSSYHIFRGQAEASTPQAAKVYARGDAAGPIMGWIAEQRRRYGTNKVSYKREQPTYELHQRNGKWYAKCKIGVWLYVYK